MIGYKISKIYLKNFKLFDQALIEFNDTNLVVLDGPNGFGKTTIFDSIELVVTGKISRISNNKNIDGRETYKDILVCNDHNLDTIIMVEFRSLTKAFTIVKKIDCSSINTGIQRNPNNLGALFKTYKIDSFNENFDFSEAEEITQTEIEEILKEDLITFYNLFYYIEQEGRINYLKKSEKDRMKLVSALFNTSFEDNESKDIKLAKDKLDKIISKIDCVIEKKATDRDELSRNIVSQKYSEIPFEPLVKWKDKLQPWDEKEPTFTDSQTRNSYITYLENIKSFLTHYIEFNNEQTNKELRFYVDDNQSKLLEDSIVLFNFLDSYSEIDINYKSQRSLREIYEVIRDNKFEKIDFTFLEKLVKEKKDFDDIKSIIQAINQHKLNSNQISKLIDQINKTRETLISQFNNACQEHSTITNNECPLCGYSWGTIDTLLNQIQEKKTYFSQFYDESILLINGLLEELFHKYFNGILLDIHKQLDIDFSIQEEFYKQISQSYPNKDRVINFIQWCDKRKIKLSKYCNKKMEYITNMPELIEALKNEIRGREVTVSEEYHRLDQQINFAVVYKEIFDSSESNVKLLDFQKIDHKVEYINGFYFLNISNKLQVVTNEIKTLEAQKDKLYQMSENLKRIKRVYDTEIKKHRSKIIKQIEIPFLIYSGRIMQDYQGGLGILIKENTAMDNIRFVSSSKTDHDAVNTLSSGQLSALIIAFTLALNKVYYSGELNAVLIDDPIQTMDDINMASFVELLRNEFSDKQIIISTHESDFSSYVRYKFLKYGLKQLSFNVKEKLNMGLIP